MGKEAYEGLFNIDNNVFTLTPKFDEYLSKNCKTQSDRDAVRDRLNSFYGGTGRRLDRIGTEAIGNKILREVDLACAKEKISLRNQTRAFEGVSMPQETIVPTVTQKDTSVKEVSNQKSNTGMLQNVLFQNLGKTLQDRDNTLKKI